MSKNKKLFLYSLIIFGIYTLLLYFLGYFKIGLLSDDYLNFYDATHSTFYDKITGHLPFTNVFHLRPVYYLSIEKSVIIHDRLGFSYDNFVLYRIQNLALLLCCSLLAGYVVLHLTRRMTLSLIAMLSVILFSNNVNNICWTAARIDLICIFFYLASLYFALQYSDNKTIPNFALSVAAFLLAILTKELAITLPFTILLVLYFIHGKDALIKAQTFIITLFSILITYFVYRFIVLGSNVMDIATLYQESPLAAAPGVFARGLISVSIPLDFLQLNYALRSDNKIILLYLFAIYGALIYLMYIMAKIDVYKYAVQAVILLILLLVPHAVVGYIRPQMAMLPFTILTIYLLWIYSTQRKFNTYLKKNVLRGFYAVVFIFWGYWSADNVQNWLISYEKSKINVENLIKINPEPNKHTVIIGNPGRYMQTLMFDKMTGAYSFWKEKQFTVNDTINDVIQTAAITESSIGAKLECKQIDSTQFEIKTNAPRHFFYIEGYNYDKTRMGFENKDISVSFLEFNNVDKPIRMHLRILSQNVSCYLADNLDFIKIY